MICVNSLSVLEASIQCVWDIQSFAMSILCALMVSWSTFISFSAILVCMLADISAKSVFSCSITQLFWDFHPLTCSSAKQSWQSTLNQQVRNKLQSLKHLIDSWQLSMWSSCHQCVDESSLFIYTLVTAVARTATHFVTKCPVCDFPFLECAICLWHVVISLVVTPITSVSLFFQMMLPVQTSFWATRLLFDCYSASYMIEASWA